MCSFQAGAYPNACVVVAFVVKSQEVAEPKKTFWSLERNHKLMMCIGNKDSPAKRQERPSEVFLQLWKA